MLSAASALHASPSSTRRATGNGWVSPRLKVRFELVNVELHLDGPDGRHFATYVELAQQREQERQRAERLAAQLAGPRRRAGGL